MGGRHSWHRCSKRLTLAAALLCSLVKASAVHAASPDREPALPFRVVGSSSAGCGPADTFSSELSWRTNRLRPAAEGEHAIIWIVETFTTESGVRGQLTTRTLTGTVTQREVPGPNCREVESAMALIAALMVDPLAGSPERKKPGAQLPERPTAPATAKQSNLSIRLDARLTARTAVAPGLSWGAGLGVMLTHETSRFRPSLALSGQYAKASTSQASGSARFEWVAAQLLVCPLGLRPADAWDARICGLFRAGRLRGAGFDTDEPATKSVFWSSAGAQLETRFKLIGPVWGGLEGAVELPFSRDRFYLEPQETLHRVPAVGMSFGAGLGLLFF
jgi:hypothetical protein